MNPLVPIEYLVLWAGLLMTVSGLLAWRSSEKARRSIRVFLAALRVGGLGCLAVVAMNPGRWVETTREKESELAVLLDRSASMATPDEGGVSRWEAACKLAKETARLAGDLDRVRFYVFDGDIQSVGDRGLEALVPDGQTTDLRRAIEGALRFARSGGRRLAGVLLLSDGRQIVASGHLDAALRARSQDAPVFPLALGGTIERKDLSVEPMRRHYVTFKGQRTRLAARVRHRGLGRIRPAVRLLDKAGVVLEEQTLSFEGDGEALVSFTVTPEAGGYFDYRIEVAPWEGEDAAQNNETRVGLAVLDGRIRILMVEGAPYWDSKFIAQLLRRQPNMEVTSVYRLSADRFFRVDTELADAAEMSGAVFPDSERELGMYDIIIFGKGAEYFLHAERVRLLREFVRDRGGCVLLARGKPYNGVFPELEALEPVEWGEPFASPFTVKPTVAGASSGLFGDMLPGPDDPVWSGLPPLSSAHRVRKLKAFSDVLVEGRGDIAGQEQALPIVVRRRYGKGMVVVVNADGLWQWDFFPSVKETGTMYQDFWSQLIQWSATFSEFLPGARYALGLSARAVRPGEAIRLRVTQRHPEAKAPAPEVRVFQGETTARTLRPAPVPDDPGRWETVFSLEQPGTYRITLHDPTDQEGVGELHEAIEVLAPPREEDNLSADPVFLRELAEASGGQMVTADDLASVLRRLAPEEANVDTDRAVWQPAWDRAWFLGLTALCFAAEWFVRRRNGLL